MSCIYFKENILKKLKIKVPEFKDIPHIQDSFPSGYYIIPSFDVIITGFKKAIEAKNTKKHPQIRGFTEKFKYLNALEMCEKRYLCQTHGRNWDRK